jgi:hypothetical protein
MSSLPAFVPGDGSFYRSNWLDASSDFELATFMYPASQESHDMYSHAPSSSPMCIKTESKIAEPRSDDLTPARHSVSQRRSPSLTGSMTSSDSDSLTDIPLYAEQFSTVTEARKYLVDEDVRMLQLLHDDWQIVKESFHFHCARLFEVLAADPIQAPATFSDFQVQYYQKNQDITLTDVRRSVLYDPAHAEARVMVVIDEVLRLHEKGAPLTATMVMRNGTKTGYRLDEDLICSERVAKVIAAAQKNKCVAHDILNDKGVKGLVLDPDEYLKRKQENARVNAKKSFDKIKAKQLISPSASWSSASSSKRRYGAKGRIHVRSKAGPQRRSITHEADGLNSRSASASESRALSDPSMQMQPYHQVPSWPQQVNAQNVLMNHVQSAGTFHQDEEYAFHTQGGARKRAKHE